MKIYIVRTSFNGMPDLLFAYTSEKMATDHWRKLAKRFLGDDWRKDMDDTDILEALGELKDGNDLEFSETNLLEGD